MLLEVLWIFSSRNTILLSSQLFWNWNIFHLYRDVTCSLLLPPISQTNRESWNVCKHGVKFRKYFNDLLAPGIYQISIFRVSFEIKDNCVNKINAKHKKIIVHKLKLYHYFVAKIIMPNTLRKQPNNSVNNESFSNKQ